MQSYVSFGRNEKVGNGTDCRGATGVSGSLQHSLHVQIRAIEPVAVSRESQNKGLIVAHESGERDCLSVHPAGEGAVGLRLTYTGVPCARNV